MTDGHEAGPAGTALPQDDTRRWRQQHFMRAADFALGGVECLHFEPAYHYEKRPPDVLSWESGGPEPPYDYHGEAWSRAPEWGVFRIANAFTYSRGIVARAQDGAVYPGSLHEIMGANPPTREPRGAPTIAGRAILATVVGTGNYGHWLVDVLPRISWMRREMDLADAPVIVHEVSPPVVFDMLAAIGVPRAQVHVIGDRGAVCEELVVCSLWSHGPKTHRHEVFAELTHFTAAMRGAAPRRRWWQRRRDRNYPERVFLAREDASNRFLTNAAALEARLLADGFVKFNTGKLPLIEQIELFHAAREVVAIAGASLTNMLFCQPGYRLTMLAPRSMPAIFFWDLAHHTDAGFLAAHYGVADNPKAGIKSDFSVDLDSVWPAR